MLTEKEKRRIRALWRFGNSCATIAEDTLDGRNVLSYSEILKEVMECVEEKGGG